MLGIKQVHNSNSEGHGTLDQDIKTLMRGSQGMGSGSLGIGLGSHRKTQNVIPSPTSKGQ